VCPYSASAYGGAATKGWLTGQDWDRCSPVSHSESETADLGHHCGAVPHGNRTELEEGKRLEPWAGVRARVGGDQGWQNNR